MKLKFLHVIAPVAVLAAGVGGVFLLKVTAPEPQTDEAPPRPITVYTRLAERTDTVLEVETQGQVRARTAIALTAQVSGRVIGVAPGYIEGGEFAAGTALLRIEDSDYRLALRQAEADVAAADLAIQQALADADVAEKQLRGIANPSELSLKKPQIAQAKAQKEAALANLELAKLNLERTRVSLPFGGRVGSTAVHIGEYVTVGTPLGQVFAVDRVQVRLPLSNRQLAALGLPIGYIAAKAGDTVPVLLSADVAGASQQWQGTLLGIDAAIDPETRLIYATAEVEDPYGSGVSDKGMPLAVGLFVDAQIEGRRVSDAVQIPREGLRPGEQLYVVDSGGLLEIRRAEVLFSNSEHALIDAGVRPGERVVVSALRNPVTGMSLSTIDDQNNQNGTVAVRGN
ncbi:MAG: efflux RND transporter periplasmic adaptor subunit [Pseudomonadota bacterium]